MMRAQLTRRAAVLFNTASLALRTQAGAVTVTLARDQAPETSIQVARLFEEVEGRIGAPDVVVYNASGRLRGLHV